MMGLMVGIIFIQLAASSHTDVFQQLVDNTNDPVLRERMVRFKEEGIEREVRTDHYNVEEVIQYAESMLGTPHRMGGYSAQGIDCSGLVKLVHARFDVELPHSSHEQARYGKVVYPEGELMRGDLVFFHSTYTTTNLVTHSGIYLGEGQFIHTSTSKGVMISDLRTSAYWSSHYLFATRVGE